MKSIISSLMLVASLFMFAAPASADDYADTVSIFKNAGESGEFFKNSYAYAVFPTVGKAGLGVGAAHGSGRVFAQGKYVGDASMSQLTVGFQLGGQAYSQIVFFKDQRAFKDFTSGNFAFGAEASAVAITAAAGAKANTSGSSAGVSGGRHDARTVGEYNNGMATFTVAKGGLMYEATIGGQKFGYTPR
jgi:lipid-binding SYLF domain-containing protein